MPAVPTDVAESFSRHSFQLAFPHLSEAVRWEVVGGEQLDGRAAVVAACEATTSELVGVTTTFDRFRTIISGDCVVVDSVATYATGDGTDSVVASCDIYDFADGELVVIRSHTTEVGGSEEA